VALELVYFVSAVSLISTMKVESVLSRLPIPNKYDRSALDQIVSAYPPRIAE